MILKNEFLSNKSIIIAGFTARLSIFLLRIHCRLKRQRDILEIYIYLPFAHIKMIVTLEKIQNIFQWIAFTPQLRVDFGRSLMTSNFIFWPKAVPKRVNGSQKWNPFLYCLQDTAIFIKIRLMLTVWTRMPTEIQFSWH